ncbi:unnamed protein product, partial [Musa textilis]
GLSDGSTPYPERRFSIHGLERASTIGFQGLERASTPYPERRFGIHGLERASTPYP